MTCISLVIKHLFVFCFVSDDIHSEDLDPEDLQPFPTLKRCFEAVDQHTGFNIEIKYPQSFKVRLKTLYFPLQLSKQIQQERNC